MEILQLLTPSLTFRIPLRTRAVLQLQNLTLHRLGLHLLSSHPDNYLLPNQTLYVEACQTLELAVDLKYYQESNLSNFMHNQICVLAFDADQGDSQSTQRQNINIIVQLNDGFRFSQEKNSYHAIKISRQIDCSPLGISQRQVMEQILGNYGKPTKLTYWNNCVIADYSFLVKFTPELRAVKINKLEKFIAIRRAPIITVSQKTKANPPEEPRTESSPRKKKENALFFSTFIGSSSSINQFEIQGQFRKRVDSQDFQARALLIRKSQQTKQEVLTRSFAASPSPPRTIRMQEHVLRILFVPNQDNPYIFVLTSNCAIVFKQEDMIPFSSSVKLLKDQAIVIKSAKDKVLVGNGNRVFVIHPNFELSTLQVSMFSVERKTIEDVERYPSLSSIAIVGKNISKLSFLGKQTLRCNIKLYKSFPPFQYIGNYIVSHSGATITSCNYLEVHEAMVLTLQHQQPQELIFVRIKGESALQILLRIELGELGIAQLIQTQKFLDRLVVLESNDGRFYVKEIYIDDKFKSVILNKDPELSLERLRVDGVNILGFSQGQLYVLREGLWIKVCEANEASSKSSRLWICQGQEVHSMTLQGQII